MFDTTKKIVALLSVRDRKISCALFLGMFCMGLLEVIGIALVVPFMMMVADPEAALSHKKIVFLYNAFGFTSHHWFLFTLGVFVFFVLIGGNVVSALSSFAGTRFASIQEYKLSVKLLSEYLHRPYAFYLTHNTADMAKNILTEVSCVTEAILRRGLEMLSKILVVLLIFALLIYVDPILALTVSVVLGGSYCCVYWLLRGTIIKLGEKRLTANLDRFKAANESMGGIKDIKLLGIEDTMLSMFSKPAFDYAKSRALALVIETVPKYFLESIAFGGIVLIVLYLLAVKHDFSKAVPFLALYAFSGYRLMPSLQIIYKNTVAVRTNLPKLDILYEHIKENASVREMINNISPLSFKRDIRLQDIQFRYENIDEPVINNMNLSIQHNTTVGFVGSTGAGKTTLVDIILGLLPPSKGNVIIDDVPIDQTNLRAWQKNMGYVPQSIFLADVSIASNIAFGVPHEDVDLALVEKAAKLAHLDDFIETLPESYQTQVGERGVRLSGGQRQRIGIARALYRDPQLFIFDEATSALDNATENSILKAIHTLAHQKTIIMIAHRLTTIKACDVIYVLDKGKIQGCGTYEELLETNGLFQRLAMKIEAHEVLL